MIQTELDLLLIEIDLKKRILELSHKNNLSHISSCLNAVKVLAYIYANKKPEDIVILSCGHAGLALYVVLEKFQNANAAQLLIKHGVHPSRSLEDGIYCSSGSLGHGLPIAIGMAIAKPDRHVYVICSDGELGEGSMFEARQYIQARDIKNIKSYVLYNHYGAYSKIDFSLSYEAPKFEDVIEFSDEDKPVFLRGLEGHYHKLTDEEYEEAIKFYNSEEQVAMLQASKNSSRTLQ